MHPFDLNPYLVRYWTYKQSFSANKRMLKKLALSSLWFFTVPLFLLASIFLLRQNSLGTKNVAKAENNLSIPTGTQLEVNKQSFSANNQIEGNVLGVEVSDFRSYLVSNFLAGTPLEGYSDHIVQTSDKYGLDYRLIPAIAMKESSGGVAVRAGSHNAWGWENGRTNFSSWEAAINTVGKTLKTKYYDRGLVTPDQIMPVYAPPQLLTGGKWAKDINLFFSQLESL